MTPAEHAKALRSLSEVTDYSIDHEVLRGAADFLDKLAADDTTMPPGGPCEVGRKTVTVEGKQYREYILVYADACGEIPEGFVIHHLCQTKYCINPHHLACMSSADHRKTHNFLDSESECSEGHPYTEDNTYYQYHKNGWVLRTCLTCRRRKAREYKCSTLTAARSTEK